MWAVLCLILLLGSNLAWAGDVWPPEGWRLPTDADYTKEWSEYRQWFPIPFHVSGDFNGDGLVDDAWMEDQLVAGEKASVTVFRQDSPYQLDGRVLVTVLVARSRWFGMTSYHIERGLVFSPGEQVREATETELQNSGG
jgi:hypothetical protein